MCDVCNIFRVNQSEYLSFNVNLAFSKLATTTIKYHILATRTFQFTHAMATQFGKLQEFRPETDCIKSNLQRVTLYFEVNEIDSKKQVAVLLTSTGAPIYTLLSHPLAPATPNEKTLEQISIVLLDHFSQNNP